MKKTGFICDESYFWHSPGSATLFRLPGGYVQTDGHAEDPETKRRFKNLLERSKLMKKLVEIEPITATEEQIAYFHTPEYINKVKHLSDIGHGDAGELALVGKDSYEIALLSAGGAITAVEKVVNGELDNAYALTRPPGHHAEADKGMGFCLFNNVVIAAEYAKRELGVKKIAIVDWDVHHGNGTENAFLNDSSVLFISLHQDGLFPPFRGTEDVIGEGDAAGTNINIPLPAGTGDKGYLDAMNRIVAPTIREFEPELIIISAGQDANMFDPLARTMVTMEGYRQMTAIMTKVADEVAKGKLVACHEGGYSRAYVPFCSHAIVEELVNIKTDVEDPFSGSFAGVPNKLFPHEKDAIDRVINIHKPYWNSLK